MNSVGYNVVVVKRNDACCTAARLSSLSHAHASRLSVLFLLPDDVVVYHIVLVVFRNFGQYRIDEVLFQGKPYRTLVLARHDPGVSS